MNVILKNQERIEETKRKLLNQIKTERFLGTTEFITVILFLIFTVKEVVTTNLSIIWILPILILTAIIIKLNRYSLGKAQRQKQDYDDAVSLLTTMKLIKVGFKKEDFTNLSFYFENDDGQGISRKFSCFSPRYVSDIGENDIYIDCSNGSVKLSRKALSKNYC